MTAGRDERWAVVFDFDGVIADTEPLHYRAFQQVLEPLKLGFGWDEYMAKYIGFDDRDAFQAVYRGIGAELDIETQNAMIRSKAAQFIALAAKSDDVIYDGVPELMRECRRARLVLGICSGALAEDIRGVLGNTGLLDEFERIVTADDVKAGKPDPEGYRLAVSQLGVRPGRVVAIEDTPAGITAARSAGVPVVGVTTTHASGALRQANLVIGGLNELSASILVQVARQGASAP